MSESEKQNIINYLSNYWVIDVDETLNKYENMHADGMIKCSALRNDIKYNIINKADLQADNTDAEEDKRSKCIDGICWMRSQMGAFSRDPRNAPIPFHFPAWDMDNDKNSMFSEECKNRKVDLMEAKEIGGAGDVKKYSNTWENNYGDILLK